MCSAIIKICSNSETMQLAARRSKLFETLVHLWVFEDSTNKQYATEVRQATTRWQMAPHSTTTSTMHLKCQMGKVFSLMVLFPTFYDLWWELFVRCCLSTLFMSMSDSSWGQLTEWKETFYRHTRSIFLSACVPRADPGTWFGGPNMASAEREPIRGSGGWRSPPEAYAI